MSYIETLGYMRDIILEADKLSDLERSGIYDSGRALSKDFMDSSKHYFELLEEAAKEASNGSAGFGEEQQEFIKNLYVGVSAGWETFLEEYPDLDNAVALVRLSRHLHHLIEDTEREAKEEKRRQEEHALKMDRQAVQSITLKKGLVILHVGEEPFVLDVDEVAAVKRGGDNGDGNTIVWIKGRGQHYGVDEHYVDVLKTIGWAQ